jgi:hypothetical protein
MESFPPSHIKNVEGFLDPDKILHAIDELVRFGQKVGVSPEEIIALLDSGIGVRDLLAFFDDKASCISN